MSAPHHGEPSEEDICFTLVEYIRKHPQLFLKAAKDANLQPLFDFKLAPHQAADMKVILNLPGNKLKDIRTFLQNHGIDVIPADDTIARVLNGK